MRARAAGSLGRELDAADAERWCTAIGSANTGITTSISIDAGRRRGRLRTTRRIPRGRETQGKCSAEKKLRPDNRSHEQGYPT